MGAKAPNVVDFVLPRTEHNMSKNKEIISPVSRYSPGIKTGG